MSKTIKLDESVILVGEEFNLSVWEDPKTRTLGFSILMKNGDELIHQHISSQLDTNADKQFATYQVRAIGKRKPVEQDEGGEVIVYDYKMQVVTGQEFHDAVDRQFFKKNTNV